MRKFYQIYFDGFNYLCDDTKFMILNVLKNVLGIEIFTLQVDNNQIITRFYIPTNNINRKLQEIKIGNSFIQISCTEPDLSLIIYECVKPVISNYFNEEDNDDAMPF